MINRFGFKYRTYDMDLGLLKSQKPGNGSVVGLIFVGTNFRLLIAGSPSFLQLLPVPGQFQARPREFGTPASRSVGKCTINLNDSVQIRSARNVLNASRRVLQRSVLANKRVDMLQSNNAELARRVSSLQSELCTRTLELQACKAECFRLRLQLNRFQSVQAPDSLTSLKETLDSLIDRACEARQTVVRMHDGFLVAGNAQISAEDTMDMSVEGQPEKRTTICQVDLSTKVAELHSLVSSPQTDRLEVAVARTSVQSVEMEWSSSSTLVESPDTSATEEATATTPRAAPPPPPASVYSLDTSADHMYEAPSVSDAPPSGNPSSLSSSNASNPLPSRKDRPDLSVRFDLETKNSLEDDRDSEDSDEDYNPRRRVFTKKNAVKWHQGRKGKTQTRSHKGTAGKTNNTTSSAPSNARASAQSRLSGKTAGKEVDTKSAVAEVEPAVNDENKPPIPCDPPVATGPHPSIPAPPGKKRRQPLLIAEDSVFLPVPDAKTESAGGDPVEQQRPVVLLERQSIPDLMVNDVSSSVSKVQETRPSGYASQSDEGDRSSMASNGYSSDRPHRRTVNRISYAMPSLGKKIRQGDSDWCKDKL
ncbi:hypothetical protein SprV_0702278500 [Sparganum proliferum]